MSDLKSDIGGEAENGFGLNSSPQSVQEFANYMENLLQGVQDRFQSMSDQIISRIDDVGQRVDDLGKSLGDLMMEAGVEVPPHLKDV